MNKNNLEYLKRKIDIVVEELYETRDGLNRAKRNVENGVIINGKPLDEDKMLEDVSKIDLIIEKLLSVRNHCNQQLDLIEQNEILNNDGNYNVLNKQNYTDDIENFRGDY